MHSKSPLAVVQEKCRTGKGSIQFPYDKKLPKALISKIAARRVKELRERDVRLDVKLESTKNALA